MAEILHQLGCNPVCGANYLSTGFQPSTVQLMDSWTWTWPNILWPWLPHLERGELQSCAETLERTPKLWCSFVGMKLKFDTSHFDLATFAMENWIITRIHRSSCAEATLVRKKGRLYGRCFVVPKKSHRDVSGKTLVRGDKHKLERRQPRWWDRFPRTSEVE